MIALRLFVLFLILCSVTYAPLAVTIVLVCGCCLYFKAYEIIILGFLIDAFYGAGFGVPYYLLGGTAVFIITEWIKPRLLMYNR